MKKLKSWLGVWIALALISVCTHAGSGPGPQRNPALLRAIKGVAPFRIAPPENIRQGKAQQSATIIIDYLAAGKTNIYGDVCTGWPEDAKTAFTYAAGIWEATLTSSVSIKISACWADLDQGVLGYGGATQWFRSFENAPVANVWYPAALASALANKDLCAQQNLNSDITLAFNANTSWYLGTDGLPPMETYDLTTVVLHELCHGLGFIGSMAVFEPDNPFILSFTQPTPGSLLDDIGSWGYDTGMPFTYDLFTEDISGTSLIDTNNYENPSIELAAALRSDAVYFNGKFAKAANEGDRPKLFAPSEWMDGSSYSHLDNIYMDTTNALMCYALPDGSAIHDPGPITKGIMQDIGWSKTKQQISDIEISITQPSETGTFATNDSSLTISGTMCSPETPITSVTWQSDKGATGQANIDTPETWSIPSINLDEGKNVITATADNGKTNASDQITITYAPPSIPLIYIEEPSAFGQYSTSNSTVTLSGVVYNEQELITDIVWQNNMGGSGKATLSETGGTWTASDIALTEGQNTITVTASSSKRNTSDSIVVTYTAPPPPPGRALNDFDGDGKSDLAVYHPETGDWYIRTFAGTVIAMADNWGRAATPVAGYRRYGDNMTYLTPGDYTGNGITDIAVFNKFSDSWYVKETLTGLVVAWGLEWSGTGAIPVPGDYDGDKKTDFAIFEPSTGLWKIWTWQGSRFNIPFGWSEAIPVPGDYDGDGITDFGVYHPDSGNWYIWTWQGSYTITQFGWSETEPVPADYNGDGKTDLAVYHQASGTWHIITSDGYQHIEFGWSETAPVPGDYNGDGKTDLAVYHQASGTWYIWTWSGNFTTIQWGWSETVPVRAGW